MAHKEGTLLTAHATDSQTLFYNTLLLTIKKGMKEMIMNIDPGVQANIVPLSRYQKLFPYSHPVQQPKERSP